MNRSLSRRDAEVTRRQARDDARRGTNMVESHLLATEGPRRDLEGLHRPADRWIAAGLGRRVEVDEITNDIRPREQALARLPSVMAMNALITVAAVGEWFGALLVVGALGIDDPVQRSVLSVLLAGTTIGFSAVVNAVSRGRVEEGRELRRHLLVVASLALYAVFVLALAIVRLGDAMHEGVLSVATVAEAVIMVALSVGPSFAADHLLRKRAPAAELTRELRTLRRQRKEASQEHRSAQKDLTRRAEESDQFEDRIARRRAVYETAFQAALGEKEVDHEEAN